MGARIVDWFQGLALAVGRFLLMVLVGGVVIALVPAVLVGLGVAVAGVACYLQVLHEELWALSAPPARQLIQDGEPAWPRYFSHQFAADVTSGWRNGQRRAQDPRDALLRWLQDEETDRKRHWYVEFTVVSGLFLSTILTPVLSLVVVAVHGAVAGLLAVGAWIASRLFRFVDWVLPWCWRIHITCPSCYEDIACPVYSCQCGRRHRDIRPGPYGVSGRTCLCIRRLPTLRLRASQRLTSSCPNPRCGKRLPDGSGAAKQLVVAMVGPSGAGKTRLAVSMLMAIEGALQDQVPFSMPDETLHRYADIQNAMIWGRPVPQTDTAPQTAYSIHVRPQRGRAHLIHFFDAAGVWFHSREDRPGGVPMDPHRLGYLKRTRSFVYVVDPIAVDAIWNELPPALQDELLDVRPVHTAPAWRTFDQTLHNLKGMGVRTRGAQLAVVVTKADKLGTRFPQNGQGAPNDRVADGLARLGLGGLVRSTRRFKPTPKFFYTAATVDGGQVHPTVLELTKFVVSGRRGWEL